MKVFRVESTITGEGPWTYQPGWLTELCDDIGLFAYHDGFPCPDEEGLNTINDTYVCGTATLDELCHWFPDILRRAMSQSSAKFQIVIYEVPVYYIQFGLQQCIFAKERSNKLQTLDLITLR